MSQKRKTVKRPCSICRRWFTPDPRARHRQKTCSTSACRAERKRRSQADWSSKNPDYWTARRLAESTAALESGERTVRETLDTAPVLRQVPDDVAQDVVSLQGIVLLSFLAKVIDRRSQDEMRRQASVIQRNFQKVIPPAAQDETEMRGRSP